MPQRKRTTARAQRAGISLVVLLSLMFPVTAHQQQRPPQDAGTLRVSVPIVNIYCTVKSKRGGLISNLTESEFEVFEDGKKQELRYFEHETERPLTLAVLLDTSGSQSATLPAEKEAVNQFHRQVLRPGDLSMIISFDTDVDLLEDFTSDTESLREALGRAKINSPSGLGPTSRRQAGTRLYDAVYLASREKLGPEAGRKAIIIVSDGMDTGSYYKEKAAIEAAHRGDVIIYAVGIFNRQYRTSPRTLKKLAEETGGFAVFPENGRELRAAFDEIGKQLRSQYVLSYSPSNRKRDGKFRKIKVKVKPKGLKVQARRGYYAPREGDDRNQ